MYDFTKDLTVLSVHCIARASLEVIRQNQHTVSTPILTDLSKTELITFGLKCTLG